MHYFTNQLVKYLGARYLGLPPICSGLLSPLVGFTGGPIGSENSFVAANYDVPGTSWVSISLSGVEP